MEGAGVGFLAGWNPCLDSTPPCPSSQQPCLLSSPANQACTYQPASWCTPCMCSSGRLRITHAPDSMFMGGEECLLLDARRAGTLDQAGALAAGALGVPLVCNLAKCISWTLAGVYKCCCIEWHDQRRMQRKSPIPSCALLPSLFRRRSILWNGQEAFSSIKQQSRGPGKGGNRFNQPSSMQEEGMERSA